MVAAAFDELVQRAHPKSFVPDWWEVSRHLVAGVLRVVANWSIRLASNKESQILYPKPATIIGDKLDCHSSNLLALPPRVN